MQNTNRGLTLASMLFSALAGWTPTMFGAAAYAREQESHSRKHKKTKQRAHTSRLTHDPVYRAQKSNPLRGYYARHSHVLTEIQSAENLNKSKFQGFRKQRVTIEVRHPAGYKSTMTVWR